MITKFTEKGQALIVVALAGIVLFGFAALAIDGSMAFSDRRKAQNAADSAALAAALAFTRGNDVDLAAEDTARTNGYDGITRNEVIITTVDIVAGSGGCPGDVAGMEITVNVISHIDTTLARVVGRNEFTNSVKATSRGCGFYRASLFNGNAIVSLNPNLSTPCSFDSGNSNAAHWEIVGGGIFSNGCAFSHGANSVNITGGCVTSVSGSSGFDECPNENQTSQAISYPADVLAIMPPDPCTAGGVGLPAPASGSTFTNGVYCIYDLDRYDQEDIILSNATLYVKDLEFNLKFAGGGGFSGTASHSGVYADYYMIVAYRPAGPCPSFTSQNTQVIRWRGNGSGELTGTILAPSACLDLRGNATTQAMNSQFIGYFVGSNGSANVYVNYQADQNPRIPVFPSITLLR